MRFKTVIRHTPGTIIDTGHEKLRLVLDDEGYGTLDTEHPGSIERLLNIPEGFRPEGSTPAAEPAAEPTTEAPTSFKLTDPTNGAELDLATLSDDQLREFIAANELKGINGKAKGDKLRAAIIAAVQG